MVRFRRARPENELFDTLEGIEDTLRAIPRERIPRASLERYERELDSIFRENDPGIALDRARTLGAEVLTFSRVARIDDCERLVRALAQVGRLDGARALNGFLADASLARVATDLHAGAARRGVHDARVASARHRVSQLGVIASAIDAQSGELEAAVTRDAESAIAPLRHAVEDLRADAREVRRLVADYRDGLASRERSRAESAVAAYEARADGLFDRVRHLRHRARELDAWIRPYGDDDAASLAKTLAPTVELIRRVSVGGEGAQRHAMLDVLRGVIHHPAPDVKERLVHRVYEKLAA